MRILKGWVVTLVLASVASACLWDTDTLRAEAQGLPEIADIIVGRFERPPPAYFEARLERATKAIEADPDDLDAYDDAAVSLDRLARQDEALVVLDRKQAALDRLGTDHPRHAEHTYRTIANRGTVLAHRWFRNGADREDMDDLRAGRDLIAAAIELNPDAHFGRERYQLLFMEWLLDPAPEFDSLASMMEISNPLRRVLPPDRTQPWLRNHALENAGYGDAAEGLAGLISLGAAWESFDVFYCLSVALVDSGHGTLASLAIERCRELRADGRGSIHPVAYSEDEFEAECYDLALDRVQGYTPPRVIESIEDYYPQARASADEWLAHRNAFIESQIATGKHPDTHDDFWAGYVELPAPEMPGGFWASRRVGFAMLFVQYVMIPAFIVVCVLDGYRRWRRSRTKALAA